MLSKIYSIYSLLLAVAILLLGSGLLGTTLGIHAGMEGFSDMIIGIVMAAFFLGYVVGSYWCPRLIEEVGPIRAFAVFAAIGTVSVIVHGLIVHPAVWWLLRVVTGICMVGLYLVIESWLNSLLDRQNRGKIFGAYVSVTLLSLGTSQYLLLIYGAGALATLALCAIFFSLALVPIAVTRLTQPTQVEVPKLPLRRLLAISPLGVAGTLATGLGNGSFWALGALYAHSLGFEEPGIAQFMSAVIFGGALLQVPIGHLSDRHDRRKVLTIVCFCTVLAALGIFFFAEHSKAGFLLCAVFYGGFSFAVYSLAVAHTNDHIDTHDVMNATRGLLLLNGIGAATGPIIAGILMQWFGGQSLILYFATVFGLLGSFSLYRMVFGVSIAPEDQGEFVAMSRTGQAAIEMDPRVETNHAQQE
ncbi:MAG: MFS transporter [Gammaproteobacteria bacterium]|nr:MFS transporter [Gammaproteobacteria bacterium]